MTYSHLEHAKRVRRTIATECQLRRMCIALRTTTEQAACAMRQLGIGMRQSVNVVNEFGEAVANLNALAKRGAEAGARCRNRIRKD